jgi:hypothetical protein
MMLGFDYTARIDPAALKAAGCSVAFRYTMPQTPFWTKALRNAEAAELLAAGIPIVSNFESTADRMRSGAQGGHDDAVNLLANWAALGAPKGLKGWFSADWDVQPTEVATCLAYLAAAAAVLGGTQFVGVYGGYRMVKAAADAGYGIWQTTAWSYGQWDPRAAVRQTGEQKVVGGVSVDVNEILDLGALGAWTTGDNDMTPEEHNMLAAIHQSTAVFSNDQWYVPGGREQVVGKHAWRLQSTLDNTNAINAKLDQLLNRPATDVAALAAALSPLLQAGASAEAVAAAVVAHLSVTVGTK